jgi:hypothetical protein
MVSVVLGCKEMQALTAQPSAKQTMVVPTENGPKEVIIKQEPFQYKTVWRILDKSLIGKTLKTDYPYTRFPDNLRNLYYVIQCDNSFSSLECEYLMQKIIPSINNGDLVVKVSDLVVQDTSNKFYTLLSYNQGTYKDNYLIWNDRLNRFILDVKK